MTAVPITTTAIRDRHAACITDGCTWTASGRDAHRLGRRHADNRDHEVVTTATVTRHWKRACINVKGTAA